MDSIEPTPALPHPPLSLSLSVFHSSSIALQLCFNHPFYWFLHLPSKRNILSTIILCVRVLCNVASHHVSLCRYSMCMGATTHLHLHELLPNIFLRLDNNKVHRMENAASYRNDSTSLKYRDDLKLNIWWSRRDGKICLKHLPRIIFFSSISKLVENSFYDRFFMNFQKIAQTCSPYLTAYFSIQLTANRWMI